MGLHVVAAASDVAAVRATRHFSSDLNNPRCAASYMSQRAGARQHLTPEEG